MSKKVKVHRKTLVGVVVEHDADGFFAYCPGLQGCYSQGRTYEEALKNIRDAARLHLTDRRVRGERLASVDSISTTTIEVAA